MVLLKERIDKRFFHSDGYFDITPCLSDLIIKDLHVDFSWENTTITKEKGAPYCGYQSIGDFDFFGILAGGDWEMPIFFLLYLDRKKRIRAFVPDKGQEWNRKTRMVYGNHVDDPDVDEFNPDWTVIKDCIIHKFNISDCPFPKYEDKIKRLDELKFYCPGDEAGEYFQAFARLAEKVAVYGSNEEFEWLFSRCKAQAEFSKEFAIENNRDLEEDFITGLD
jgi:hypothetical protein